MQRYKSGFQVLLECIFIWIILLSAIVIGFGAYINAYGHY
jgi:hypothetical protein